MPVQGLGVEETAFPIAAAEGGRRAARVLGVAAASTSTVVPLGRLRRAAGAHIARSRQMQGEAAPPVPGRRAAAATGCLDKAAARSAGLPLEQQAALLPRQGRIWLPERPSFVLQLVTEFAVGAVRRRAAGGVAGTPPAAPALKWGAQA